jgi:alkylhydroperoxidase family enzyme
MTFVRFPAWAGATLALAAAAGPAYPAEPRAKAIAPEPTMAILPMLSHDDAWKRLPGASVAPEPLPAWARMLAGPLPKSTAAMLNLDALHRAGDERDPKLRAMMRWVAADANGCVYAKAAAAADLRRAGAGRAEIEALAGDRAGRPDAERAGLTFARKLTARAASVTDDEVNRLISLYGDRQVVAMVALLAHAAFQDRIILALDPPIEEGGPPGLVRARFPHSRTPAGPPPKSSPAPPDAAAGAGKTVVALDREWLEKSFDELQQKIERQRARPARIRIPLWEEVSPRMAPDAWGRRWPRVVWGLVCYGHQPETTDAWFDCVDAFRQETRMDRLFQQDLFWVITRANDCFY